MKAILVQIDPDYKPGRNSVLDDVVEALSSHEIPAVVTETALPPAKAKELCLKAIDRLISADDKERAIRDTLDILGELASGIGFLDTPAAPEDGDCNVTVITADGETKRLKCADTGLEALQKLVGGLIEVVPESLYSKGTRRGEDVVLVNEEGRMLDLPVNWTAMGVLDTIDGDYGALYGDVVIIDKQLLNRED